MTERKKRTSRKKAAKPKVKAEEPPKEMTDAELEAAQEPVAPVFGSEELIVVPADGTLIRMDGAPTVYVMSNGERRPLGDANVFAACGFGWNEIVVLPAEEIDPIPVGEVVARQGDL